MKKKEKAVVVCTDKKGVFFGYTENTKGKTITLKNARMCVYWSADMRGVLGLASVGPSNSCKVSGSVPELDINGITCVMSCTEEASKKWEVGPWNS